MLLALKKGISTAIGIATMSIVSAGILGSGHYSSVSTDERVEVEASQLATYLNAVQARINEGYTFNNSFNTENPKNPKSGSLWSIDGSAEVTELFIDDTTSNPKGLVLTSILPSVTSARHLFANKKDRCVSYPIGKENQQFGFWQSKKHNNLIPCNIYRIYGPLRTSIAAFADKPDSAVIIIKRSDKKAIKTTTNPTTFTATTPNDRYQIDKAMIAIPLLNTDSQADKKIIIQLARTLKAKLQSDASVFYTLQPNNGDPKIKSMYDLANTGGKNHGLSSSLILGKQCEEPAAKAVSCFLNIHLKPLSGIGSGCDDCLKQDGSNSMHEPITFLDEDGSSKYPSGKPLIVWDSLNPLDPQKPTNTEVVAGFVLSGDDFVIKSASKPVFSISDDAHKIEIKDYVGTTGLKIDTQSGTNLVEIYNANASKLKLDDKKITVSSSDNVDIDSKTISLKATDKIIHTVGGNNVLSSEKEGVLFDQKVRFNGDIYFNPDARLHAPMTSNWNPYPGDGVSGAEIAKWGQQIPNVAKVAEIISKTSLPLSMKMDILEEQLILIKGALP